MQSVSKVFKIKIKDVVILVTADSSYIAENIYKKEFCDSMNGVHYHSQYELFFVGEEAIKFYCNNEESEFSNCILSVPPFLKHCTMRRSGYRITFSYKSPGECFLDSLFSEKEVTALPITPDIMKFARETEKHFFGGNEFGYEMTESFLKLIFCSLAQMHSCKKREIKGNESYLNKIENILFDFKSDINLKAAAEKLGLSTKQTTRILMKNYNATLSQLICERRLSVAGELLINTDMTIAEIVEYINFPSDSYFYLKFKKTYGVTPSDYRKQKR